MPDHPHIITRVLKQSDAAQILYGLELRGVRARTHYSPQSDLPYAIAFESPTPREIHIQIAVKSLDSIWDAILEDYPRATLEEHCYFCQYDVRGLARPTICPECGHDLDSIGSRRAMRDKRKS